MNDEQEIQAEEPTPEAVKPKTPSLFRNFISFAGFAIVIAALTSIALLVLVEFSGGSDNPYTVLVTYILLPSVMGFGFFVAIIGALLERRRRRRQPDSPIAPYPVLDLNDPSRRRSLVTLIAGGFIFLFLTAFGSYRAFEYTESVSFCGEQCHTVMKPEFISHQAAPHASIKCVDCHVGGGPEWYVRSKFNGMRQLYAVAFDTYDRPIKTPLKNLRLAQDTCEQCHWPQKYVGNLDRTYTHFLADETNTPFTVRLSLKVGGGDPTHGPVGGIHWHMNLDNKVEYIATDEKRQQIPWVRLTDSKGVVTEFRTEDFKDDPSKHSIRTADCMDCHNRPTHAFQMPERAVDEAMNNGQISPTLPFAKKHAVELLRADYPDRDVASTKITGGFTEFYRDKYPEVYRSHRQQIESAAQRVLAIYRRNVFPHMKVNWGTYPNNIGHEDFLGCFRCHDGSHTAKDGRTISQDCNACHTILTMEDPNPKILTDLGVK